MRPSNRSFFVVSSATSLPHLFIPTQPHHFIPSSRRRPSSRQVLSRSQSPRFYASSDLNNPRTPDKIDLPDAIPANLPATDLNPDQAAATAQALFDDLADRPEYYLNISGVLLGITLSCVVLSATLIALDSIPLIPDLLRMIGLAYLFWFLNKFLFSASERERLTQEISDFVAGVRGPDFSNLEQPQSD